MAESSWGPLLLILFTCFQCTILYSSTSMSRSVGCSLAQDMLLVVAIFFCRPSRIHRIYSIINIGFIRGESERVVTPSSKWEQPIDVLVGNTKLNCKRASYMISKCPFFCQNIQLLYQCAFSDHDVNGEDDYDDNRQTHSIASHHITDSDQNQN